MSSLNVQISKRKKGRYATIIETFIDPVTRKKSSRSIKTFGYIEAQLAEDPNYLDKIYQERDALRKNREEADRLRAEKQKRIFPAYSSPECQEGYRAAPRLVYGDAAIRSLWEELQLDHWFKKTRFNGKISYDLDLAVFYMVACRMLLRGSRRKMIRHAPQFFFNYQGHLKLDNLNDALGQISRRKDTIIRYLTGKTEKILPRDTTLVFYDVTTFYFESFEADSLRDQGMSKEHRTHETQVVLGLLIDRNGIPLNYEVFKGNTAETKTLMSVVEAYKKALEAGRVIVVADRGLNSKSNLSELRGAGCDYIVAHTIQRLAKARIEEIFKETGWKNRYDSESGELLWRYKSFELEEAELKDEQEKNSPGSSTEEKTKSKPHLIVTWSPKRYFNDMKQLQAQWEAAQSLLALGKEKINSSSHQGSRQFLKSVKGQDYRLNQALYEKKCRFAGYYGLVTSCEDLSDEKVYGNLRELREIEENFRIMKTYLGAHPVYVRTEEHIRGHFLVCVLAVIMERIMHKRARENGLDYSFEYLSELLTAPTLSPIYSARNKEQLYLKTGVVINSNPEGEPKLLEMAEDADKFMKLFGIEPLRTLESLPDLRNRLKVHLPLA